MKIEIKILNAMRFTKLFIAASRWISKYADVLNDLNVFPVPDGDTGTNISMTLQSLENDLVKLDHEPDMKEFVDLVSESIILGANGTSGIIFGNIIVGFLSSIRNKESVTIDDVAQAFVSAKERGYSSVPNPKEGTILTVVRRVAEEAKNYKGSKDDFIIFLSYLKDVAYDTVKSTPDMFPILKQNGVVDAGGMAFFYLLEGFEKSVSDPEMLKDLERIIKSQAIRSERLKQVTTQIPQSRYRYNLEFLVESESLELENYKNKISSMGDILYCIQIGKKTKTQINTDFPWELLKLGDSLGRVYNIKLENTASGITDNISSQGVSALNNSNIQDKNTDDISLSFTDIAIVTDSGSDLNDELIAGLEIFVIPLKLKIKDSYYSDGIDMTRNDLWTLYRKEMVFPKASPPSPTDFKELYSSIFDKGYKKIISIHISNKLSGTQQAAKVAKNMFKNADDITIVDSETLSVPLGHLVLKAAKMAKKRFSVEEIIKKLDENIGKMRVYLFADDISYLKKQNRLTGMSSLFSGILHYMPVFKLEQEKLVPEKSLFSDKKAFTFIKDILEKESQKNKIYLYTLWGGNKEELLKAKIIKDMDGYINENIEYCGMFQIGSAVASYCGPVYGFGYIYKNKEL